MNQPHSLTRNAFHTLFYTFLLSEVAASMGGLVSSIVVGNLLAPTLLACLMIGKPCTLVTRALSSALALGGVLLYSTYTGKNEPEKAERVFSLCVNVCLAAGLLITILFLVFIAQVLLFQGVGTNSPIFEDAKGYVFGISVGTIPYMLNSVLLGMLKVRNRL